MGNPELSHQIGQVAHNVKEAGRALLDSNLFQSLQDIGHPYGLLLGANSTPEKIPSSEDLSTELSSKWLSLWSIGLLAMSVEGLSDKIFAEFSGSIDGISAEKDGNVIWLAGVSSFLLTGSLLKGKSPTESREATLTLPFNTPLLKLFSPENSLEKRQMAFQVGRSRVSLGTCSMRLREYKGEQPFTVKTPEGEPVTQINPGDPLGSMHVSRQASFLCKLPPLGKIQAVTGDILSLFKAIDQPEQFDLSSKQQETLNRAKSATIIGISHLTRLLRRKTGLPTWKLNVLPEAIQKLHRLDSQAVSDQFGGGRKVKRGDIEMLVITPAQRQMLAATA